MQLANKQTKIFVIIITTVAQVIIIFGDGKPKEAITAGQGVAADNVKGSHVCVNRLLRGFPLIAEAVF